MSTKKAKKQQDIPLPIFMGWSVREREKCSRATGEVRKFADLLFQEKVTHTLEGPMAKQMLQSHADEFNRRRYVPDFSAGERWFKLRPTKEAFLAIGKGERPFVL